MPIDIECGCGKNIEFHARQNPLYNEDYTPYEITCSCCGAIFNLCIHLKFVKDGNPGKKWPDDDPEEE